MIDKRNVKEANELKNFEGDGAKKKRGTRGGIVVQQERSL